MPQNRKYKKIGVETSTGRGKFDVAEYNTENQILTITIRPRFNFEPFPIPTGVDPLQIAQWPQFLANMTNACKTTFKAMVEAWGGHHHFVCTEPGLSHLSSKVVVESDEIIESETITPGTSYTPVIFGNVGRHAFVNHSINVDHSDGYTTIGGITAFPIIPAEYVSLALGFPPPVFQHYTLMHELGHIFGLGDEYESSDMNYSQGLPTLHSSLAVQELNKNVFHGWNDKSIMSHGGESLDVHGVTFLTALRKITGLKWAFG